eukprot:6418512-Amphidinium_carterae.1
MPFWCCNTVVAVLFVFGSAGDSSSSSSCGIGVLSLSVFFLELSYSPSVDVTCSSSFLSNCWSCGSRRMVL